METQLVTKHLELPNVDCRELFFTKLCNDTGYTLLESEQERKCECSKTNERLMSKEDIKKAILAKKNVLLYLAIDSCRVDEKVYTTYDKAVACMPFIIVGWSDHEMVSVKTPIGITKRHRGYFTVVPAFKEMIEENIHYIPYKHFLMDETSDEETPFIKEVWAIEELDNDIIEYERPSFEMVIGKNCIVCEGMAYCTDACAFYNTNGAPLIPLREIAKHLGYTVTWSRFKRSIDIISHEKHIKVTIGEDICTVDGNTIKLSVAPTIDKYTKRTFVNLSFIRHVFGLETKFDKETEKVIVYLD